jgi:hypothetical protein
VTYALRTLRKRRFTDNHRRSARWVPCRFDRT